MAQKSTPNSTEKKPRQYKGRELLNYMTANADRPVTVDELSRYLEWGSSSISASLGSYMKDYPGQLVRNHRGIYTWYSTPKVEQNGDVEAFLLEILSKKGEDTFLTQDSETQEFYIVKRIEF